jgi:hypothetical protein
MANFVIVKNEFKPTYRIMIIEEGYRNFLCQTAFSREEMAEHALKEYKDIYLKRWEISKNSYKY